MYNSKFYGYVIKSAANDKGSTATVEAPDFQRVGLSGILNYMYSTNPNKCYYGYSQNKN